VYTPRLTGSILQGITRKSVIELLQSWNVKVNEVDVSVDFIVEAAKAGTLTEAYGVGTAATIAHIKTIGFRGTDFELPAVESREISNKVSEYFKGLKTGRVHDDFGWMVALK